MAIVVVYDSVFGNTGEIAKAIADELGVTPLVRLVPVAEAANLDLSEVELLIVGSPTRGFRPTPFIVDFIEGLDATKAAGRPAAAFDTRLDPASIDPAPLRWVVQAGGYAADRIGASLTRKGFTLAPTLGDFRVGGTEGPLVAGEIERARAWARGLTG